MSLIFCPQCGKPMWVAAEEIDGTVDDFARSAYCQFCGLWAVRLPTPERLWCGKLERAEKIPSSGDTLGMGTK